MQTQHEKRGRNANTSMRGCPTEQVGSVNMRRKNRFDLRLIDSRSGSILLVGGPYQGMHIREEIDANGLHVVNGVRGEFVYKLHKRKQSRSLAVPLDATRREIRNALFRLAALGVNLWAQPE